MIDLINREDLNRFENLMSKQTEIKRTGRAKVIDSLFQVAQQLKMEDKSIVYQAASLMDRFYDQPSLQAKPQADGFLTGYVSLFIASKNTEVEPLSLSDIKNHFLQSNYTR